MADACDSEMFQCGVVDSKVLSAGRDATALRRQDACRHGKATECANVNMTRRIAGLPQVCDGSYSKLVICGSTRNPRVLIPR